MTIDIGPCRVHWEEGAAVSGRTGRRLVIGYSGSDASRRALRAALTTASPADDIVLVCAVRRRSDGPATPLHDALKSEAYLLTASAGIDELLRCGREAAHAAGAASVDVRRGTGSPSAVLAGVAAEVGASVVVLGMSGRRPGGLARTLHRRLSADVDLVVTDGTTHLHAASTRPSLRRPEPADRRAAWDPAMWRLPQPN
ncbi:universal stress protein [Gordonia sp. NPDC003424]